MPARPVIGIPADRRMIDPHPFHIVGEKYVVAVHDGADAMPVLIPPMGDVLDLDAVLGHIDGLMLTGSPSNVEPRHYEGDESRPGTIHDPHRDATTLPLARKALAAGVPLLAVCRGFQELNVVLGGSLHQHVDEVPGYHRHNEDPEQPLEVQYGPSHPVTLIEGGLLRKLAGTDTVQVNSLHSQGIAKLADGVTVEAVADDDLIEGFSVDGAVAFALAVQWHPEWQVRDNPFSLAIFRAFGDACREYASGSRAKKVTGVA
jgi:putative glutamine amidotransferase